jgi:hypothetical protein
MDIVGNTGDSGRLLGSDDKEVYEDLSRGGEGWPYDVDGTRTPKGRRPEGA